MDLSVAGRGLLDQPGRLPEFELAEPVGRGEQCGAADRREGRDRPQPALPRGPAREVAIIGTLRSDKEATVFARYVLVGRVLYGMIFYSKERGAKKAKKQFDAFVGSLTFDK